MIEIIEVVPATLTGVLVTHIKGGAVSKMIAPDMPGAFRVASQWLRAEWWQEEGNC